MKTLKLLIKGEEKTFSIPFVNGMVWRKYIEYRAKMNLSNLKPEEVDTLIELVVYAFGNQFTLEQFYEGTPHDKIMPTFDKLFSPTDQEDEDESDEGNEKK
jgi:hypothetical protein